MQFYIRATHGNGDGLSPGLPSVCLPSFILLYSLGTQCGMFAMCDTAAHWESAYQWGVIGATQANTNSDFFALRFNKTWLAANNCPIQGAGPSSLAGLKAHAEKKVGERRIGQTSCICMLSACDYWRMSVLKGPPPPN